jgi:N-acetylated-alpha-linked acidic dipeptidase
MNLRLWHGFSFASCAALSVALVAATPLPQEPPSLLGFTPSSSAAQLELEARYDGLLDPRNLEDRMRRLTRRPFFVGSPGALENAEWIAGQFREWGFQTRIDTFHVLFPTPVERSVEMLAPDPFTARLREPALEGDATSGIEEGRLPTYNAYSADGEVEGELVYVNYGVPADYEELERRGISVEGKIVIARYGGSWRGIKPKVAAEHGAIGCIIYSDPRDDGYFQGDVYPEGPYRMEHGVQRGSVLDMPQYPGDPLTPGVGATQGVSRQYTRETAPTLMKIPVLPLSYADAQPLLQAMGGPVVPESWRGALPITYHMGPGPSRVRIRLRFEWKLTPVYDVVAVMEGSEFPDEWVVRGNHIDGWAMGAGDPISGMVALMEEARAVGELARQGMRPRRTIVYAGWDAEEPGLLGSTEWAEHHARDLQAKAVAYINTDGSGRGFLGAGGSHSLERLVTEIAGAVEDPQTGVSVLERRRARQAVSGDRQAFTEPELRLSPLGSGSDYTPFLQHLGIASLNLGFGGESGGGSYHSMYDSFDHYRRFGDPGFPYGVALAKTAGRVTLRLANADLLPFRFSNLVYHVDRYVTEVMELERRMREETEARNELVSRNAFALAADPTRTFIPPQGLEPVPFINFAPVKNASARLAGAAKRYDAAATGSLSSEGDLPEGLHEEVNALIRSSEQLLTDPQGLPRRPWFRHQLYAPGFYTGYGVKTLPGIREGLEERSWDEATLYVERVASALDRLAERLEVLAEMLEAR